MRNRLMFTNPFTSGMKMAPEVAPLGAISAGSGDRIRTCDLWVMSQPVAVSRRRPRLKPAGHDGLCVQALTSRCTRSRQLRRRFVPKSVPKRRCLSAVRTLARLRRTAPSGWERAQNGQGITVCQVVERLHGCWVVLAQGRAQRICMPGTGPDQVVVPWARTLIASACALSPDNGR